MRSARMAAVIATALFASSCGSSTGSITTSSTTTASSSGDTVQVVMKSLAFDPSSVSARVGQRVVWTNDDNAVHNVTYVSGPRFKSSGRIRVGRDFSITVTKPGTIHYYCSIHPWMTATIVVSP